MFGPRRDDLRHGVIASVIANVNRGPRQRPVSPEDFVLRFEAPPEPEEVDPFAAIAKD